jgi:hypothetical protein
VVLPAPEVPITTTRIAFLRRSQPRIENPNRLLKTPTIY